MTKFIITALFFSVCGYNLHAQWIKKVQLPPGQVFNIISPVDDSIAWLCTYRDTLYITANGGTTLHKINPPVFSTGNSITAMSAISVSSAIICALNINNNSSGVYKTIDTGKTWKEVLPLKGMNTFLISMSTAKTGLLVCTKPAGTVSDLYRTINGGNTWNSIPGPQGAHFFTDMSLKKNYVWLINSDSLFYSADYGIKWSSEMLPATNGARPNNLCMESNTYGIFNSGVFTDLFVKRPGVTGWQHIGDPGEHPFGIALECMLLQDSQCMFAAPQDVPFNYYSADSAKTFTRIIVQRNPPTAFSILEKSRTGKNIWAATSVSSTLWVYENKTVYAVKRINKKPSFIYPESVLTGQTH